METDRNYTKLPVIKDLHKNIDARDLHKNSYYKIPKRMLLKIMGDPDTQYTDIIVQPMFLISERIKNVLEKYEPNLNYKEIILLDQQYGRAEKYFLPTIEGIDCLEEESEFNLDHSILNKIVIDSNKTEDKCIFAISGVKNRHIIVRLDFVESILRRNGKGFRLKEIECKNI